MISLAVWLCAASSFALAAIWFGYPLIVAALAALRCSPLRSPGVDEPNPSVSVVLATRDSVDAIVARITNALHTSYPPDLIQIVVALDAAGAKAEPSLSTEALPTP